jgi:hypothetical protein
MEAVQMMAPMPRKLSGIPRAKSLRVTELAARMLCLLVSLPFLDEYNENNGLITSIDLNGDGRADYIEIDPASSAITVYLNACQA